MKRQISLCLLLAFSVFAFAQAPSNDSCNAAQLLTVNATAQYDTFQILNATSDKTGCGISNDVWFKFAYPNSGGIRIRTQKVDLNFAPYVSIYTGSCGSLTQYACLGTCDYYSGSNCGDSRLLKDTGLIGDTLYLRVSMRFSHTGSNAAVSVQSIPDADFPLNDSCGAATDVTANLTSARDTFTLENSLVEASLPSCGNDEDVWVKFEVPTSGGFDVRTYDLNGGFSPYFKIFTGGCATLTEYSCQGNCDYYLGSNCGASLKVIDPDLASDTVWVKITNRFGTDLRDSFSIDLAEIPTADFNAHDSCAAARDITTSFADDGDTLTLEHALADISLASCGIDEDVWAKFEVPSSGGFKIQTYDLNGGFAPYFRMYEGGCGALSIYDCSGTCDYYSSSNCGPYLQVINPAIAGDTVWVRISNRFSTDLRDSFRINITEIATSAFSVHDSCESAKEISANLYGMRDTLTLENATNDANLSGCGNDEDIWVKFEVPTSGAFSAQTYDMNGGFNPYFRIYTGGCDALSVYGCNLGNCNYLSSTNCGSGITFVDTSTAGDTLWMRISNRFNTDLRDSFELELTEILADDIITNDKCATAIGLTTNLTVDYDTFSLANALVEESSSCGDDEDVWFKFEVPANGAFEVQTFKIDNQHSVYMQLYTGICGSLTTYNCSSNCNFYNASNTCGNQLLVRDTSLAGDTVYLKVKQQFDGYAGDFSIGVRSILDNDLPENDDCTNAQNLNVNQGSCITDTFHNQNTTYSVVPSGTCGGFFGADAWFSFVMPSSDDAQVEMTQGGLNNKAFRITAFSGSCASLVEEDCSSSGNYPDLSLRNLGLAGDTVWLHVYREFTSTDGDSFGLCVKDTVLPPLRTEVGQYERTTSCQSIYGDGWFDIVDSTGKLVMSIDPNSSFLGQTCFGINIQDSSANIRTALDTLGNMAFVGPRNFFIDPQGSGIGSSIRLYFTERELSIWRDSIAARGVSVGSSLEEFYQDSIRISKIGGADLNQFDGADPVQLVPTVTLVRDSIVIAEFTVSSFSNFIPVFNPSNNNVPVPVNWLYFEGAVVNGLAHLKWATASELNCAYYEIEKGYLGKDFQSIGRIHGNGTVSSQSNYQFIDAEQISGKTFYRIRQVDFDGQSSYSQVVVLQDKNRIAVSPNPFTTEIRVNSEEFSVYSIELYDLLGRRVLNEAITDQDQIVKVPKTLNAGVYTLKIITENEVIERRLIKQ